MPKSRPILSALCIVCTLLADSHDALGVAENWYAPATPVTEDLYGVGSGGPAGSTVFVAVGAGGVTAVSTDRAVTWIRHSSGVDVTLRGVAVTPIGPIRAVAVGDGGTIVTSSDFTSWTARTSGTMQTLHAVAAGPGMWLAVGDGGVLCRSTDGMNWTVHLHTGAPVLRAVVWVPFMNAFAVGGDDTYATTTDGFTLVPYSGLRGSTVASIAVDKTYSRIEALSIGLGIAISEGTSVSVGERSSSITRQPRAVFPALPNPQYLYLPGRPDLKAVVTDASETFVAVGGMGHIWTTNSYAAAFPVTPTPGANPARTVSAGSTARLAAEATSPAPLEWQWSRGPLTATIGSGPVLEIPSVSYAHNGAYLCIVTNASALVQLNRTLTVLPAPASRVGVSAGGSEPAPIVPGTDGPLALPGGRTMEFLLADNALTLRRRLADGSLDPAFAPAPISLSNPYGAGFIYASVAAYRDAEGRILVRANGSQPFPRYAGTDLFRLTAEGAIDTAFQRRWHPGGYISIVSMVGAKLLCTFSQISPSTLTPGTSVALLRLNADGSSDATWPGLTYSSSLANGFQLPTVIEDSAGGFYILRNTRTNEALPQTINTGFENLHWIEHYDAAMRPVRDVSAVLDLDFGASSSGNTNPVSLRRLDDGTFHLQGSFIAINGTSVAGSARITPDAAPAATHLTNLSVRTRTGDGDASLIVGFVLAGSGTRPVLARGIGPGLAPLGVSAFVANPMLRLYKTNTFFALNDDWSDAPNADVIMSTAVRLGASAIAPGSKDAALLATIDAGAYTAHVTASGQTPGVALAEVYDHDTPPGDFPALRVSNFSARARVGSADSTLIAGFVVSGPNTLRLLIRAVGPGLAAYGVSSVLADPRITLYSGSEVIAQNDNRAVDAAMTEATSRAGAFPLNNPAEAALLVTLPPGPYTVHVQGPTAGATGAALVEVYELP